MQTALGTINVVSDRRFGVEIECFGPSRNRILRALTAAGIPAQSEDYNHSTRGHWKLVRDGSIRNNNGNPAGTEIVSPILCGEAGLAELKKVCDVLKRLRARVNASCGLHVHHDVSDLALDNIKSAVLQYARCEKLIGDYMPAHRRNPHHIYCKSMRSLYRNDFSALRQKVMGAATVLDLARAVNNGGSRYFTLNLQNFATRGTLEFRHHSGTTDFEMIASWVVFTQSLIEFSRQRTLITAQGVDTARRLFIFRRFFTEPKKSAVKDLKLYFRGRAERLARAEAV